MTLHWSHRWGWGSRDTNSQGRCTEDFIPKQNVCLLNTENPTYFHEGTGSLSATDLSRSIHEDLCGSVITTTRHSVTVEVWQSWLVHLLRDSSIEIFTEKLVATNDIPKSNPGKCTANIVWCNSDCKEAIPDRRKVQKWAEFSPTAKNKKLFRECYNLKECQWKMLHV